MDVKIKCSYMKLLPIDGLKPHPKNRNKHPKEQITRLSELIAYQGIRHPIIVSNLSGFIVAGHGRAQALKKLGLKSAPVDFQDFDSEEKEYAFLQSDNAIQEWADLDLSEINNDLGDLGPDFNIDMLGIKSFKLEPAENIEVDVEDPKDTSTVVCPQCEYEFDPTL